MTGVGWRGQGEVLTVYVTSHRVGSKMLVPVSDLLPAFSASRCRPAPSSPSSRPWPESTPSAFHSPLRLSQWPCLASRVDIGGTMNLLHRTPAEVEGRAGLRALAPISYRASASRPRCAPLGRAAAAGGGTSASGTREAWLAFTGGSDVWPLAAAGAAAGPARATSAGAARAAGAPTGGQ